MAVQFTLEEYPLYDEAFAKGMAKGDVKRLLRLIERRVGTVPDNVAERVRNGSAEDFDRWFDAIGDSGNLTAAELDSILDLRTN
ncbi:DUF4351 domain-containing protein [Skermanella mucosa]|uniref:hypothetical protein n=1 Tax=Skermanella mucosa TaxID=1789672 RepID=UPI00192A7C57|nr:hypothetical protein [Skermanella mucosa]UEM21944.1 DUF4351 domain-containing protein [Skermanella mucosa]